MFVSEIAVVVVVGIDHDLFDDDFRVNHDEFQCMLAWGNTINSGIEPAQVVEYLIATGQH